MTCIVAIAQDNKVYMGADSASVGGWTRYVSKEKKLFKLGAKQNTLLIGVSGSWRSAQLLHYHLQLTAQDKTMTDFEYLVVHVSETMRTLFHDHGLSKIEQNVENEPDTDILIGYRGALYNIQPCWRFQVLQGQANYAACGGGEAYALGALAATTGQRDPIARIVRVLKAVETHYIGVCPPFETEVL